MPAPVNYNPGDLAVIDFTVTDINDVLADPGTIVVKYQRQRRFRAPIPTVVTYTIPDAHVTRNSIGDYTVVTDPITKKGAYDVEVSTSGGVVKTLQTRFYVRPSVIET